MNLLTNDNPLFLWRDTVQDAEARCAVTLDHELEAYLISLLRYYIDKPDMTSQRIANAMLEAHHMDAISRRHSFRKIGDQCLIFAGLFPRVAERKNVKISYFVDMGRNAYISISSKTNDVFELLALQFVVVMDVLQSIRPHPDLLPLEAYELWRDVGSQRALRILSEYTHFQSLPKY